MHILLIHQAFALPNEPGGTRHYELAHYCATQGHNFTIIASNLSYLTGRPVSGRGEAIAEENVGGVRVLRTSISPVLHRSFFWRIVAFLSFMVKSIRTAKQARQADLIIGTSPPIFQAVSAWLVAAMRRRPFLLEIRDLWPEFAVDLGVLKNPVLIALSRGLERFLYARATHLLVNSPAYRDYLLRKGISPQKVSLVPNGVDPDMFDPQARGQQTRSTFKLDGKFVVTYAGALGLANDAETILRAAAVLKDDRDVHFLLVGDGKERANLEALAGSLQLTNVAFTGSRPKTEMADILAASDVCTATLKDIPMFRTTYPNKVFDYMAAGRPTVLAIDGVIREVIEAAGGGICVPPGDSDALAAAIRTLAHDRVRAKAMGEAARAYVIEHFNRHYQSRQFLDLIVRVAAQR